MLIVVEGPDCVGKSTLVERLRDAITTRDDLPTRDVFTFHSGPPTQHPLDEYVKPLLDYWPDHGRNVICDRWHLGEYVYPTIFGRTSQLDAPTGAYVDLFLRARGALLVYVDRDPIETADCLASRGDDLVTPEQASSIHEGFLRAFAGCLLPRVVVHGLESHSEAVTQILDRARDLERAYAPLAGYVTYVGTRAPALLLLGDVRHNHRLGDRDDARTTFMPYPATSGHYLLNQLVQRHGVESLRHVGIANACDEDDPAKLYQLLGQPPTVALGRNAERATSGWTRYVPHPQHQRRFAHHAGARYADLVFFGKCESSRTLGDLPSGVDAQRPTG